MLPHTKLVVGISLGAAISLWTRSLDAQAVEKSVPITAEGASFSEPAKWIRLTPDKPKTKGWFISPDSDRRAPAAMIMIDVGKPTDTDLRKSAESMARSWNGKVLEEKTSLDGEDAFRIRVEKPVRGLHPVEGILALHNGKLYMVMGGVVPGQKVAEQVEEVRKGWRWMK